MRKQRQLNLLATPLFVVSIALLALNDFVLKAAFHNWLTGKLSDISGLIAFTVFACAIWPSRRWFVATIISAAFVLWKSPYSQPVIDLINSILPFSLGRTPDYSDYIALPGGWLVCLFILRLRPWPMRSWLVGAMAILSLMLFAATSRYIPMHRVTRTALIPAYGDQRTIPVVEGQLQDLFDEIADRHGLRCTVCDPLSSGRLYVKNEAAPPGFSLAVNFDPRRGILFFDLSSRGGQADKNTHEISLIRTDIENRLKTLFPDIKAEEAKQPKPRKTLQIAVRKKTSKASYDVPENQEDYNEDYNKAVTVIGTVVSRFGLQRLTPSHFIMEVYRVRVNGRRLDSESTAYVHSSTFFYRGRLFGPRPLDRELTVHVSGSGGPFVYVDITSYSAEYLELQRNIADELEQELQATFGKKRAWLRWGSRR